MEKGKTVPAFWGKEDWQAIWIGGIVIVIACIAVLTKAFDFRRLNSPLGLSERISPGQQQQRLSLWVSSLEPGHSGASSS